jgi:hypothetical protein
MVEEFQPYHYVPSTMSEIKDFFGYMALSCPDEFPDGHTMEEAYTELEEGLGLVRKKIGDERYSRAIEMVEQSKQLFTDGEDRAGSAMLMNIGEVISGRKPSWR